jgi:hypothetical protein
VALVLGRRGHPSPSPSTSLVTTSKAYAGSGKTVSRVVFSVWLT